MAGRSLVASSAGIEKAKQALERRNLNQKAFTSEIGFAWSTVNKFFTKKPVDRTYFQEICQFLNLDWQDIVEPFSEENETQQLSASLPLTLEQLWLQLQALSSPTDEMGILLVKEETLGWRWQSPSRYEKSVRVGSQIQFEVNFQTPGYLLLLQKDTSGQMWCFCPSCFAPQPQLDTGKTSLPQEGSPLTSFPIEGSPGMEQILAIITESAPNLNWLPQGSDEPLELTENHLMQLLEFINKMENYSILYTEYKIIT